MTELNAPFTPDWVSPPGETIWDIAMERGWKQAELALRLGFSEKHVSQLINGKVVLSVDAAIRLERVLGSSADFWLAREANYQRHKARLEEIEKHRSWVPWVDELPLKELMLSGAISKMRLSAQNKPALVEECLRFFGVATPDEWRAHYVDGMQGAFRRSREEQSDIGAISSWLRLGEQQAEKFEGPKYDKVKFEKALPIIRGLTRLSPEQFEPKLRQLMHDAGVMFLLVPAIPGAHVSGVARWLGPTRPVIQQSLYGKTNDKFWFTFFHEAAHLLLHANTQDEKKSVFLDDTVSSNDGNQQEREANQWASNLLIPDQEATRLPALKSQRAIEDFAMELGIHPGIVVGRLQHDGHIVYSTKLNELKQRFQLK